MADGTIAPKARKSTKTDAPAAVNRSSNVTIRAPTMESAQFTIVGTAPLMTARFSKKAEIMAKHQAGGAAKNKRDRAAKDFDADAEAASYKSAAGWYGFNAAALRNAMISACRLVGFKMTMAKMSVFVLADGYDAIDGVPLVRIDGKKSVSVMHTRNATGVVDVRARPMWEPGWICKPRIRWDADQFTAGDVANLLMRVGLQVGLCEGRPDSKQSAGIGFGLFDLQE